MTTLSAQTSLALWHSMLLIRRFEESICAAYGQQDMQTPVHLCIGQEALYAGVCALLTPDDALTSTHRNHGCCLMRGISPYSLYAEFYGRSSGCCGGRGGSMHSASPAHGIFGTSAIVGGGVPLGTGLALAAHLKKEQRVSAIFFGDGAFEEGTTAESLNFAALHGLPVLFVCENNFYATTSPLRARQPHSDIWQKVAPIMPARCVDGCDVEQVYQAADEALRAVRAGHGPQFLEMRAYRWMGHVGPHEDWPTGARPKEELDIWKARCPLQIQAQRLEHLAMQDEAARLAAEAELDTRLATAMEKARQSPFPSPEELANNLFSD